MAKQIHLNFYFKKYVKLFIKKQTRQHNNKLSLTK